MSLHLATGAPFPPLVDGKSRLLSMEYCPFAQRARLVAVAKNLPHDIVNVNLKDKPDWIFNYHKEGKVPVLLHNGEIIPESNDVCDYLEDNIHSPVLTSADPKQKQADLDLRESFSKLIPVYYGFLRSEDLGSEEGLVNFMKSLQTVLTPFEEALKERGTKFLNGDEPGLIDYIIWPWFERLGVVNFLSGDNQYTGHVLVPLDELPLLNQWQNDMFETDAVLATRNVIDKHVKLYQLYALGGSVDYDSI